MTLWIESSPCVSMGQMFKERTFWNFLCIISWHMLTCVICVRADQVPGDLVRLSRTRLVSLVLWMLCGCQEESLEGPRACSQLCWNVALGLHYARLEIKEIYTCFADEWYMWTTRSEVTSEGRTWTIFYSEGLRRLAVDQLLPGDHSEVLLRGLSQPHDISYHWLHYAEPEACVM